MVPPIDHAAQLSVRRAFVVQAAGAITALCHPLRRASRRLQPGGQTDTAYYHRDLQYDPIALSIWTDPADSPRNIRWARELFAAWEPHFRRAVYVNDLGDEGEERARSAYGENYARLVAPKTKYDSTNFFRLNQNIKPTV